MNLRQARLPFQVQLVDSADFLTAHAGLPLLLEAFRALGLRDAVHRHFNFKQRARGYSEATCIETLVALLAAGGECVDDVRVLHADGGLKRLMGRKALPAAETLRTFLNRFHDPAAVAARLPHTAFVPADSEGLRALGAIQQQLLRELQKRSPQSSATLDVDASIIESDKRTALPVYEGGTGYQPLQVWWTEQGVWVKSQFRDGNVPAQSGILGILKDSVARLQELDITDFAVRSDSAGYQHSVLDWLRESRIPFAISADMSPELRRKIVALPQSAWKPFRQWKGPELVHADRDWAEVEFVPSDGTVKNGVLPDRYLVIRARLRQGELFADGALVHYYATVTNRWDWDGERLLRWSHERCGTVEQAHDVLKNELGGGVLPSQRFGANAAWWQLAILTANLLTALKKIALPQHWNAHRPRRLRFLLLHFAGRLVQHGRRLILRIARNHPGAEALLSAREKLFAT
ncbi:MAG: IS1380 family transposase [Candidatus Eisenbacteria bacterium]|nr:IS1380 family transposase [Candidatus Eisenbacteria bacterium]